MTDGIGWPEQRLGIEDPEKRAAAIKSSPVYRETPLGKSDRAVSPLRAIPVVGPYAGAAVESMRGFDPTRVVTTGSQAGRGPTKAAGVITRSPAAPAAQPGAGAKGPTPYSEPSLSPVISREAMLRARALDEQTMDNNYALALKQGRGAEFSRREAPSWTQGGGKMGYAGFSPNEVERINAEIRNRGAAGSTYSRDASGAIVRTGADGFSQPAGGNVSVMQSVDQGALLERMKQIDPERYDPNWQPADRDEYNLADQDIGSMTIPELAAAKLKDRRSTEKRKAREAVSMEQIRQKGALDIARLGASPEESAAKSAYLTAQAKLLGAQTGTTEAQLQEEQRKNALMAKLGDVEFQQKDPTGYDRLLQYYKAMYAPKPSDSSERAAYIAQGINPDTMQPIDFTEKKAVGGLIEKYAGGGQIPAYGTAPQQNPMLSQYGQYLSAASKSGVSPVPFAEYVKLLESTRAQPEQVMGFQDGGEIPGGYSRPEDVDWRGVLSRGVQNMFRIGPKEPAAEPSTAQPAPSGVSDPTANFWTLDPARRAQIEADVAGSRGYAEGGAIDVAGKKLVGPGTGTSDSIPAVIDGSRPAALSNGEFVIPAHVVRAKGTEFFDKLIASYADNKGQGDGE